MSIIMQLLLWILFGAIAWPQTSYSSNAQDMFDAGLYERAIDQLKMNADESERTLLFKSYLLSNQPFQVVSLSSNQQKLNCNELYLLGLAYLKLGWDEYAAYAFACCLAEGECDPSTNYALGLALFNLNQFELAKTHFSSLLTSPQFSPPATLFLAKIEFENQEYQNLIERLQNLSADDLILYDANYLLGRSYFQLGKFEEAIKSFENALPVNNAAKMPWYKDTISNTILSHLFIAEEDSSSQQMHLVKVDELLKDKDDSEFFWLMLKARKELLTDNANNLEHYFKALLNISARHEMTDEEFISITKLLMNFCRKTQSAEHQQKIEELFQQKVNKDHLAESSVDFLLCYATFLYQIKEDLNKATDVLNHIVLRQNIPNDLLVQSLSMLGTLNYQLANFQRALSVYRTLTNSTDNELLLGDVWYWQALCYDALGEIQKAKECRKTSFELYPKAELAPEAYFSYYNFLEYLKGDRHAFKHLKGFVDKFPNSPYTISAFYLIGLDKKQDRKSYDGKWINRSSLTGAIESFQAAENKFDELLKQNKIPHAQLDYFLLVKIRSALEKALTHITMAEQSEGARKQIYSEYAEKSLQDLYEKFPNRSDERFAVLKDELTYSYAKTLAKTNKEEIAVHLLSQMIEQYQSNNITKGYFLALTWFEKALIAQNQKKYHEALAYLERAEEASRGKILTTDQRLNIAILQSNCHRALENWDQALLTLSKVVNDDSISGLRIKAMVLRAEIYELQGRHEIARRQLDSASKKGGEWSQIAAKRLIKDYGYPDNSKLVPVQR